MTGNHTEQSSKREGKKEERIWRIKLVRSTEKGIPDCFNGQFCGQAQKGVACFL